MNPVTEKVADSVTRCGSQDAKRSLVALKNLQLLEYEAEAKMDAEMQAVKAKHLFLSQQYRTKRFEIVNGTYEVKGDDCALENQGILGRYDSQSGQLFPVTFGAKREIPKFWLTVLTNDSLLNPYISGADKPVLESLVDVVAFMNEDFDFGVEFYFSPNEYFTNVKLKKLYKMKCYVPNGAPFNFAGREVVGVEGCAIDWKPNKDLKDSSKFFKIFSPFRGEGNEIFDSIYEDYEFGHHLMKETIPDAVLYFTGEKADSEDDSSDSSSDEEEESDVDEVNQ